MVRTKVLVMLKGGKYAENPWGPTVTLNKGDEHPFPLATAEDLLEAGVARLVVACPDFKGMEPADVKKYVYQTFGVTLDARKASIVADAIEVFEKATATKYKRPAGAAARVKLVAAATVATEAFEKAKEAAKLASDAVALADPGDKESATEAAAKAVKAAKEAGAAATEAAKAVEEAQG